MSDVSYGQRHLCLFCVTKCIRKNAMNIISLLKMRRVFEKVSLQVFPLSLLQRMELLHKSFWSIVLTLFPYWCIISRPYRVPVPNYISWTKNIPQKNWSFWSNLYIIKVMITSLTEMLELPNFGLMVTYTIQF